MEKRLLIAPYATRTRRSTLQKLSRWIVLGCLFAVLSVQFGYLIRVCLLGKREAGFARTLESLCPQADALRPPKNDALDAYQDVFLKDAQYRKHSLGLWSGAVRIETTSYDDLREVGDDPRYAVFPPFRNYLKKSFPLIHEHLNRTLVNTHGLLYTWKGSDASLKPLLLMAHQDTVPVNPATLDEWKYPPWSGHFDGHFVWGRGASDCKNQLIAELEAVEALLKENFEPKRTLLLSFGFDEESKGRRGAGHLAPYIESVYGVDGIEMIVDEGGLGIDSVYGKTFAMPGTGEKGYVDVNFTLSTPGGHSSVPPPHTGIGILSALVTELEAHPYKPHIGESNPFYGLLQCAARYSTEIEQGLKDAIVGGSEEEREKVAKMIADAGGRHQALVQTTQAVDIISSGVKVNALPQIGFVVANHRIAVESTIDFVKKSIAERLGSLASEFGLDVQAFGELKLWNATGRRTGAAQGFIKAEVVSEIAPAPVSPTGVSSKPWKILSGVIKATWDNLIEGDLVVSPAVMTGNTDTQYYWNLTRNIYRFTATRAGEAQNQHTVNEHAGLDSHLEIVLFFHNLIRVMNA